MKDKKTLPVGICKQCYEKRDKSDSIEIVYCRHSKTGAALVTNQETWRIYSPISKDKFWEMMYRSYLILKGQKDIQQLLQRESGKQGNA